ncbi:MAG TPA: DNA polymerase III subunit delta [Bacteroidales bacterium]|nr:DNA polymerase III subunit delta [Bacteroidales bacterium]
MAKSAHTPSSILAEVKAANLKPVYFLMGEESYYIDLITESLLEQLLTESEKEFDLAVVYGKDTDMRQVISLARQYPMLAKHRVVLVKEAQDVKDMDNLSIYLEKPMPTTILIVNHKNGSLDKRKKLASELDKAGVLYESKKLYENELPGWIINFAKTKGLGIDDRTAELLAEYLGSDLGRIVSELEKLTITIPKGETRITPALVEQNIGISKEYNDFELQSAIVTKNILKANKIAVYYGKNPKANPIVKTIALLSGYFSNLMYYHYLVDKSPSSVASELGIAPFRVREFIEGAKYYNALKTMNIISMFRAYDAKAKGFESKNIPDAELLKELLYKIMH